MYPEYKTELGELFRKFLGVSMQSAQQDAIKNEIGVENYELLQRMNYLKQTKGVQAMLPYQMNIR